MHLKKILIIGPFSPPITGIALANDTLYDNIDRDNFKVNRINYSYTSFDEQLGVFSLHKFFFYLLKYRSLYKVFSNDIIYIIPGLTFFGVIKYAPFIFLAKVLKKKTIIHINGSHVYREFQSLTGKKKRLFHYTLSKFDRGIVLSDSLRINLQPFIDDDNIYIVENFVEDHILEKINEDVIQNKNIDKLRILYLSNLMTEKGIFDLFEALITLEEKGVAYEALIAGSIDPKNKVRVEEYLARLDKKVKYLGTISGEEKFNALVNSNVFVLPTYYAMEGQPLSIFEAMATGNIVLTTTHSGIPDIFQENKNGFYVTIRSPESIAEKLLEVSRKLPQLRSMMQSNYIEASDKYTVDKFILKITKILSLPNW